MRDLGVRVTRHRFLLTYALTGESSGYDPLLEEIVEFFKTGKPPVSEEEKK